MSEVRPSKSTPAQVSDGARAPLDETLSQSIEVKEKIEGVGDNLLILNTVLKQEIPETLQTGEVAQALEKHEELENIVQECVDDLAEVNEALEEEVALRQQLERDLAKSQAELAKASTR